MADLVIPEHLADETLCTYPVPFGSTASLQEMHRKRYEWAASVAKDQEVVELGCGAGYGAVFMQDCHRYLGIDLEPFSIEFAWRYYAPQVRHAFWQRGNVCDEPVGEGRWDRVVAFELLEHLSGPDQYECVRGAVARLRPGGLFLASAPLRSTDPSMHSPHHVREPSRSEFLQMFEPFPLECEGFFYQAHEHAWDLVPVDDSVPELTKTNLLILAGQWRKV